VRLFLWLHLCGASDTTQRWVFLLGVCLTVTIYSVSTALAVVLSVPGLGGCMRSTECHSSLFMYLLRVQNSLQAGGISWRPANSVWSTAVSTKNNAMQHWRQIITSAQHKLSTVLMPNSFVSKSHDTNHGTQPNYKAPGSQRHLTLSGSYIFQPIALETLGPSNESVVQFLCDMDYRITSVSVDDKDGQSSTNDNAQWTSRRSQRQHRGVTDNRRLYTLTRV